MLKKIQIHFFFKKSTLICVGGRRSILRMYMYVCMCACMYMCVCICMYGCVFVCVCVYMCVLVYMCVCMCVGVCVLIFFTYSLYIPLTVPSWSPSPIILPRSPLLFSSEWVGASWVSLLNPGTSSLCKARHVLREDNIFNKGHVLRHWVLALLGIGFKG